MASIYRGACHDEVNPRREDVSEEFQCYGPGVPRYACVPAYSGLGWEEERIPAVKLDESVGCGGVGVRVDVGPCV